MFLRTILAFLKKDIKIFASYKLFFLLSWAEMVISVTTFYYIGELFGKSANQYLIDYKTDYFTFVLIGIALSTYLLTSLRTFSNRISEAQTTGTFEAMLVSPRSSAEIIIGMSAWDFTYASIRIFIYLFLGVCLFGVQFNNPNIIAGIIILLLTIICFACIGIIAAGFILVFKRGEPIGWFIAAVSGLFGGVYFPTEILHPKLQIITHILPITYALRSLRHALLNGYSLKLLLPDILTLVIFCIVLLPLALLVFVRTLRLVKTEGSLVHF